jgi:indolepyruvate ferredoxin oxidoreductase alpha subunit
MFPARGVRQLRLGWARNLAANASCDHQGLLENGVGYVAGYQGAPISHLMDVLADAPTILGEVGMHFASSANEAAATTSALYPIRGAVRSRSVHRRPAGVVVGRVVDG